MYRWTRDSKALSLQLASRQLQRYSLLADAGGLSSDEHPLLSCLLELHSRFVQGVESRCLIH